ncbi:DUF2514 domain-containing protein [Pectobacterium sp. 21LCBS03]|uniref:DUF2514 domain-containing protein n=1 Tax=Pectobacterium sp. 21LCBS03 TaxID=2935858 RepID=UPI00200C3973|nr:DUF2514 domain-containing protein [Pectobacterium sp. 21LCBS03]UPY96278.1 DUF2514 domain-containing protein [Pectobacterium sp. 21LCBS03]
MTIITAVLKRYWQPLIAFLMVAAGLCMVFYAGHNAGYRQADNEWSEKWAKRDTSDANELALRITEARDEEQRRQRIANENRNDAQNKLAAAKADADNARAAADSLHAKAERLAKRLAESERARNTGTTSGSQTGTGGAIVLAELFRRADERAGELAEALDRSRIRGLTCERAYDSLTMSTSNR